MDGDAPVTVFAPAKINLTLHVVGRRDDGYHLLDSLVVFVDVGDRVAARRAASLTLEIAGPFAAALSPASADNLVLRAARHFAAATGRTDGAHITLTKNLPVAGGIGGGSSDAAATLTALAGLWRESTATLTDTALAVGVGADVPVCLRRSPTFMRGIGEQLAPAPALPPAWLALVNPGLALPTRDVFAALNARFSRPLPAAAFAGLHAAGDLAAALASGGNDLMAPARDLAPAIGAVLERLAEAPGCLFASMSGSGPTCFGLFAGRDAADAAAQAIRSERPAWWTASGRLL